MSGAELGLGIVGAVATVHIAMKACKKVIETCSAIKNAEEELFERSTRLRSNLLQIHIQLEIISHIESQLSEQFQGLQEDILAILIQKIEVAENKLRGCLDLDAGFSKQNHDHWHGKSLRPRERGRYAAKKSGLDKAIMEVEIWQRQSFDPLWFTTMKLQLQHLDTALYQADTSNENQGTKVVGKAVALRQSFRNKSSVAVFLPAEKLDFALFVDIPFGSIKLVKVDDKWRLIDSAFDILKETARELAVRLRNADPNTFGLLRCLGAVEDSKNNQFKFIFSTPEGMSQPETLRGMLLNRDTNHSLSDRFRLANRLARAISSIHTFDMVHKTVRPENILLYKDSESTLGSAFLFGFEGIRREDGHTRLAGDMDPARNIYRHPERQGNSIRHRYIMQHDIYSLGVCLLEIGLWTSFVNYDTENCPVSSSVYGLDIDFSKRGRNSEAIKSSFLSLCKTELPQKMGTKYAAVVEACLTCLDLGNEDFSDDVGSQENEIIAINYIEKVMMQLSEITV